MRLIPKEYVFCSKDNPTMLDGLCNGITIRLWDVAVGQPVVSLSGNNGDPDCEYLDPVKEAVYIDSEEVLDALYRELKAMYALHRELDEASVKELREKQAKKIKQEN